MEPTPVSAIDPTWVSIIVGICGSLIGAAVTGAIWYAALKSWMTKRELLEKQSRKELDDHEVRLRELERGDFAR